MATKPSTIADYIAAAPPAGQPHLRRLHALLASVAPQATQTIKWSTPFFIEPRFLFAFSAHKAHCSFAPPAPVMEAFRDKTGTYKATKGTLLLPYAQPLPEDLIREMAQLSLHTVQQRQDDAFW